MQQAERQHTLPARDPSRRVTLRLSATLAVAVGLFVAALLLRLYRLDGQSLWLDEGSSWALSRQGWGLLLRELFTPTAAYPLYHLLLKAWTALFGDSEIALRLPSAIAGALAVPFVYAAALALEGSQGAREPGSQGQVGSLAPSPASPSAPFSPYALAAALIALASPYAIWYGQEAKVYGLLLLCTAALLWALLQAMRTGERRHWLVLILIGVVALFVHRLAALSVLAAGWALFVTLQLAPQAASQSYGEPIHGSPSPASRYGFMWLGKGRSRSTLRQRRWPLYPVPGALVLAALAAASVGLVAAMALGLGGERAVTGAYIPAGPLQALWLTVVRFSVDRWPGDAPWWWLLPWLALLAWGVGRLVLQLRAAAMRPVATLLLTLLLVPLALFLAQLLFTRVYEARYLIVIFPVWALVLAYPLFRETGSQGDRSQEAGRSNGVALAGLLARLPLRPLARSSSSSASPAGPRRPFAAMVLATALLTGGLALFQPRFGLFSGDPVKEQYREAIRELAAHVHPDDAVVIHPGYIGPLYAYYMHRWSTDPAPEPISFEHFWRGPTDFGRREWEIERRARLSGYTRSFLLIAPDHARTVDVPIPGDEYGMLGNHWAFSSEQRTWPCGIWRFNGAHLLCQESPETYTTGVVPQPVTPSRAVFDGDLRLLGFTLKATTPDGPGVYRAGGNLPISLFWDVDVQPAESVSVFLHLCQRCDLPPVVGEDGPPLEGYLPTSVWLPGSPARDDRAIVLPADLPPGRYTLLLGLYRPAIQGEAGRLRVVGGDTLGADRLVLGTVEVVTP